MDERKELIELLKSGGVRNFPFVAVLADYLIKNGVTVRQSLSIKVTGGEIEPVITNANKILAAEVEPVKWLPIVGYEGLYEKDIIPSMKFGIKDDKTAGRIWMPPEPPKE